MTTKWWLEEQENQQDLPKDDKVLSVSLAGKNETGGTNAVAQSCSRVKLTLTTALELRTAVVIERWWKLELCSENLVKRKKNCKLPL